MKCDEVGDLLSAFQDRELSAEEMTAIEAHLSSCADCAAKSNVVGGLSRIVKHWEGVKASETAKRQLIEKAATTMPASGRAIGPLALWLLGMVAAALLGGGAVALGYWYFGREEHTDQTEGAQRQQMAACVAVEGRVELVQPGGARLDLRGRRDLVSGQEVFCDSGSAAQLELPGGQPPVVLVLRGSGSLRFLPGDLRLNGGKLVFHVPAGGAASDRRLTIHVGKDKWKVEVGSEGTVGLVELSREESIRLAVLSGSAKLTSGGGGPSVSAGKEITVFTDAGGTRLEPPRDIADKGAFGLLTPGMDQR